MNPLLLDTNIVSYILRKHSLAEVYRGLIGEAEQAISFMTVAELYEGAFRARWGRKRLAELERNLNEYIVLPSSPELCQWWGWVRSERRLQPISVDDAWIAATALVNDLPLVTHNAADFRGILGLRIITAGEV